MSSSNVSVLDTRCVLSSGTVSCSPPSPRSVVVANAMRTEGVGYTLLQVDRRFYAAAMRTLYFHLHFPDDDLVFHQHFDLPVARNDPPSTKDAVVDAETPSFGAIGDRKGKELDRTGSRSRPMEGDSISPPLWSLSGHSPAFSSLGSVGSLRSASQLDNVLSNRSIYAQHVRCLTIDTADQARSGTQAASNRARTPLGLRSLERLLLRFDGLQGVLW